MAIGNNYMHLISQRPHFALPTPVRCVSGSKYTYS